MPKYEDLANILDSECSNTSVLPKDTKRKRKSRIQKEKESDRRKFSRSDDQNEDRDTIGGVLRAGSKISWGALWPNQPIPPYEDWWPK